MKRLRLMVSVAITAITMSIAAIPVFAETEPNDSKIVPLAKAHAHNDYEHERPLYDALGHGFTSVEADVWLKDGKLLVAHDEVDVKPERTLKSLYLEPLKRKVTQNQGSVYKGSDQDFLLWIDIKSEDVATYKKIHQQLADYQKMLTKFSKVGVNESAVTIIISGNRPRDLMENQAVRYAAYDGRMSDLGTPASNEFMPVISDNWTKHFTWQGEGEMPSEERDKLNRIVKTAHNNGQMVRFWATPDLDLPNRKAVWDELMKADVDLINTDDLPELQKYILENDPNPTQQHIEW
ncbi:phosphatidylinositol-specific phospholipase C/glycerophosphodiester phosphodiesterase family protein [Fictibacillus sp. NRS-1165]|uniref:phosphatidylinositol-specific phospholipase C/glycerophosphodiester phosphodiesterase family protein n=1 Tax=Fictibacillus sp. NRS-1165 TaxID=3144463 RepID=UPI003D1CACDE